MDEAGPAESKPVPEVTPEEESSSTLQEVEVPETFLIAEAGDYDKALARYMDTLRWRSEMHADEALQTPHPAFDICKKFYPR